MHLCHSKTVCACSKKVWAFLVRELSQDGRTAPAERALPAPRGTVLPNNSTSSTAMIIADDDDDDDAQEDDRDENTVMMMMMMMMMMLVS